MSPFTPSPFRFTWRTEAHARRWFAPGVPFPETYDARVQGEAFRSIRLMYGLTMWDVARGWRVRVSEVSDLERGYRKFKAPADMHAALQQLWCWANEKNREISK